MNSEEFDKFYGLDELRKRNEDFEREKIKYEREMESYQTRSYLIKHFDKIVSILATDDYLRQNLEAKVSCRMSQRGSHIDSMPVEPAISPIDSGQQLSV